MLGTVKHLPIQNCIQFIDVTKQKALLQDVSHSLLFSTAPLLPSLVGDAHLPLLVCCDTFLAAKPALLWEKSADRAPSAACSLPAFRRRSLVSLLLPCASRCHRSQVTSRPGIMKYPSPQARLGMGAEKCLRCGQK